MSKSVAKKIAANLDDAIEDIIKEMRKAGEAVSDDAKENFDAAAAKLREAAEVFVDEARQQSKALTKQVKKHPVEAAAIAAAAAALVGLLIARRAQASA